MRIKVLAILIASGESENYDDCWEGTNYTGTVSRTLRSRSSIPYLPNEVHIFLLVLISFFFDKKKKLTVNMFESLICY